MIFDSGSRGNISQLTDGRNEGVVINPAGETMNFVTPSFKKGLMFEYFISTHGARKAQPTLL